MGYRMGGVVYKRVMALSDPRVIELLERAEAVVVASPNITNAPQFTNSVDRLAESCKKLRAPVIAAASQDVEQ